MEASLNRVFNKGWRLNYRRKQRYIQLIMITNNFFLTFCVSTVQKEANNLKLSWNMKSIVLVMPRIAGLLLIIWLRIEEISSEISRKLEKRQLWEPILNFNYQVSLSSRKFWSSKQSGKNNFTTSINLKKWILIMRDPTTFFRWKTKWALFALKILIHFWWPALIICSSWWVANWNNKSRGSVSRCWWRSGLVNCCWYSSSC